MNDDPLAELPAWLYDALEKRGTNMEPYKRMNETQGLEDVL